MWPFRQKVNDAEAPPPVGELLPMISYAQNYEDVLARRALGDPAQGFYVDVGAAHPVVNNATYYFYERGWTGINVEPDPNFFEKLEEVRGRDINLNLAISATAGHVDLIRVDGERELNTLDEAVAQRYAGKFALDRVSVEAVPLEAVCAEYVKERIDLLKIDVEGREQDVLDSFDLVKWSPRLLIVEATWPCTTTPSHEGWEPQVREAGYELGLFDGLNRFFAKKEDREILNRLRVPAGHSDAFIQYRWWKLLTPEARDGLAKEGYPNPSPAQLLQPGPGAASGGSSIG